MSIRGVLLRFQEVKAGDALSLMKSHVLPPVTVLIAAYNEENHIIEAVSSVLLNDYKKTQIMIVNDGSTDQTLERLKVAYKLHKIPMVIPPLIKNTSRVLGYYISESHPNLCVIDKEHYNKSDCLNIGVNACRTPLFITFDADSIMEPNAISEMVFYMITREHAVAVGGAVYILNACDYKNGKINREVLPRRYVPGVQACEYLRSFLFNRSGWNPLGGSLCYSGTMTLLEHAAVVRVNGFDVPNDANDFEIIVALHAHKRQSQIPVPATLKSYWHQRSNWTHGQLRSLMLYKYMLFNPRYGIVGLFTYPFYLFCETLGACVEFTAYCLVLVSWYLGIFNFYSVMLFFFVCMGFITLLTMATVLMNSISENKYGGLRDLPLFLFYVVTEPFGFRQFSVLCRVVATLKYPFVTPFADKKGSGYSRS